MSIDDRRRTQSALGVAILLVSGGAVALAPSRTAPVLLAAAVALMAVGCWGNPRRLAWCWGFVLPVEVVTGINTYLLDAVRYSGVVWLCGRTRPSISAGPNRHLTSLMAFTAGVAAILAGFSLGHGDRYGIFAAMVMLASAVAGFFVGRRVTVHLDVLVGFMVGTTMSAVVAVMQSLDLKTLRPGNPSGSRFPGLSGSTALFTWELAFALLIALYLIVGRSQPRALRLVAGLAFVICAVGFVVTGAQGGILGLGAAAVFVALRSWQKYPIRKLYRPLLVGFAVVMAITAFVVALALPTPTFSVMHMGDYSNETARLNINREGFRAMLDHPFLGSSGSRFNSTYRLYPHFLPLAAGVIAGLLGFALAAVLVAVLVVTVFRGPVGRRPATWLGYAMLAAMAADVFTEPYGPFSGLGRVVLLSIALVACRGEAWDADDPAATDPMNEASRVMPGTGDVPRPTPQG